MWSSDSTEILLEFRIACYGDSKKCSLSAQRRWALAEESESRCYPTFLSSVFKDPTSEKQEGANVHKHRHCSGSCGASGGSGACGVH